MDMDVFHALPVRPSSAEPFLPSTNQGGGPGRHAEARCGRTCTTTLPPQKAVGFGKPISTCCADDASPPRQHFDSNGGGGKMGPHIANGNNNLSSRIGPRLRAEGLMVPPASDAATLRRQVAALQIDLEAHVDGQQRLQSINQQLRERLELYMKQNHENVERAEAELNTLHEDMEQTLELQRRLAQRATSLEKEKKEMEQLLQKRTHEFDVERSQLQAHIAHISEDLREHLTSQEHADTLKAELSDTATVRRKLEEELHNFSAETEYLKNKAEEYSNELRSLFEKEQRDKVIDTLGCKCLLRRNWLRLKDSSVEVRSEKEDEATADAFYSASCCKRGFQSLKLATVRMRYIRRAQKRQNEVLLLEMLHHWHLATIVQKKFEVVVRRQEHRMVKIAFKAWIEFVKRDQLMKQKLALAVQHRRLFVLKNLIKTWKVFIQLEKKHNEEKIEAVKIHIVKLIYKQVLCAWRYAIRLARVQKIKLKRAYIQEKRWCLIRGLHSWREALNIIKYRRGQDDKGWQFRKSRQWRAVIKTWRSFVKRKRHVRLSKALAFRHYIHTLRTKGIRGWKESIALSKVERRAAAEVNQALMRVAMVFWRDHHLHFSIKKKKEAKAFIHKMRREKKIARGLLIFWWEVMACKRRALQLEQLFASRRQRSLLRSTMHCWMHCTFDDLLQANVKFQTELKEAQHEVEDQKQIASSIDVENLQLIDRLHTMSAEIAHLKMSLTEKSKQQEDLQRALEDSAVLESSLRGEVDEYHQRIEDKKLEFHQLQKKMNAKHMEDAAAEVHHALEIQTLEQALEEKNAQLVEKANQIEAYEKSLKDSIERLEGASDENQDKLQSAFEIAASLRKLLDDREQQFATLEGNCRRRELELGEVQRKLAVANCTLCETVEARDTRIQELETMLSNKQNEIQDTLQQCSDLELALDAKETRIRKLEYEMKLWSDRESFKTKSFFNGMTSWGGNGEQQELNGTASNNEVQAPQSKECMRNTYCQTMPAVPQYDALMQAPESSHRTTSLGTTSSSSNHFTRGQEGHSSSPNEGRSSPILGGPVALNSTNATEDTDGLQGTSDDDDPLERPSIYDSGPQSLYYSAHDPTQSDWETSFALVSTSRPTTTDPFTVAEPHPGRGVESTRTSSDTAFRMTLEDDPGAVDSLHMEIQRLQARIMNRLRDSSGLESTRSSRGIAPHQRGEN